MRKKLADLTALIIPRHGRVWNTLRCAALATLDQGRAWRRNLTRSSIFYREEELEMCSLDHTRKLKKTLELFQPTSVLDLGCGTGKSLDYLLEHGVDAMGVEGSQLAISRARNADRIQCLNLNEVIDLGRKFDLVWCLEVVEHIHPKYVHNLMQTLTQHSDRIVLSAAKPGQGGEGHFNEQPLSYWIDLFAEYGFSYDEQRSNVLQRLDERFSDNMLTVARDLSGRRDRPDHASA